MDSVFNKCVCLESTGKTSVKNYSDTFLYGKGEYERNIFEFLMKSEYIDKSSHVFETLKNDLKQQRISNAIIKVLESPKTVFCISDKPMPRAFKVMVAKDVRGDRSTLKLFIDVTGIIVKDGNEYAYKRDTISILMSYLMAGMNSMVYFQANTKITTNSALTEYGCKCFASLVFYLVDYFRVINSSDPTMKGKILYYASKYYQLNILSNEETESLENRALKIAGISDREANIVNLYLSEMKDNPYHNIDAFVKGLALITRSNLTVDVFMEKWIYHFGPGTQFGTEFYPAFASMFIYCYCNSFLVRQKTIENVVGRPMVDFVDKINSIGSELL